MQVEAILPRLRGFGEPQTLVGAMCLAGMVALAGSDAEGARELAHAADEAAGPGGDWFRLHHLPDLKRAFAEFHRVLRPGGRIVFAGEPSRVGDRIASLPKRGAMAVER